jgi:ribulose-phosphate 3-epimerase
MINSPSLANCNFLTMGEQVKELVEGGVKFFHIDIMDGHYVPNLCFPVKLIADIKEKYTEVVMDVHLMVTDPGKYVGILKENGADYVSFHIDSTNFVRRTITDIQAKGMKAGVVINPSQRIDLLEPFIDIVDYVVLMTVEPGFAGQRFLAGSLKRLEELAGMRKKHNASFLISIDGGVDYPNGKECARLEADMLVTNIYTVFNQPEGIINACRRFEKEMDQL